ncbi:VOC family protein [Streptococcus halichoeri]|uniref:VOC family protein n=1 Tax=Streptococcus halichoeri TaxID=254785 RepID=UPI00135AB12F|nr:VOC family protein [Streptococcus halichoeri]
MEAIQHIHHISAIVGNVQENLDFYRQVLKLRLVKQTVNFDDPYTYHLYFANQDLDPGSLITFFPWENSKAGKKGSGQVGRIGFRVPKGSLTHWQQTLTEHQVAYTQELWAQQPALFFQDVHAVDLALVESTIEKDSPAILGFQGAYLHSHDYQASRQFVLNYMQLSEGHEGADYYSFVTRGPLKHQLIIPKVNEQRGLLGPGTVHHIAWNVADEVSLKEYKQTLEAENFNVTTIRNRKYFKSIYLRESGKIIFEFATAGPGMTVDEPFAELGQSLQLPAMYEERRQEILQHLKPLRS